MCLTTPLYPPATVFVGADLLRLISLASFFCRISLGLVADSSSSGKEVKDDDSLSINCQTRSSEIGRYVRRLLFFVAIVRAFWGTQGEPCGEPDVTLRG